MEIWKDRVACSNSSPAFQNRSKRFHPGEGQNPGLFFESPGEGADKAQNTGYVFGAKSVHTRYEYNGGEAQMDINGYFGKCAMRIYGWNCFQVAGTETFPRSFLQDAGIALATARAGNVIGGGDWAKDRIVPDAISAFIENRPLVVRNPMAVRPWQHVLEPLSGYLMLCQQLITHPENYAQGWNFGPNDEDAQPVSSLADTMVKLWDDKAQWQLDDGANPHEAHYLKLDCTKSKSILKWRPIWNLGRALEETVQWYKSWRNTKDMYELTLQQIESYQQEQTTE